MRDTQPELTAARFVVCSPRANTACTTVAERYRQHLLDAATFTSISLDDVVHALSSSGDPAGVEVHRRYLPWTQ
jgi:hypothetical protein